jgi:hypothetical protein
MVVVVVHVVASRYATWNILFQGKKKEVPQDEMVFYDLKMVGSSMSQRAMNQYVQQEFSEIVDKFLTRYCRVGNGLSISDKTLFPVFRAFWIETATETQHPALLGQFRVELAQRGFRSNGPKRPRWYGLTLHQLTVLS